MNKDKLRDFAIIVLFIGSVLSTIQDRLQHESIKLAFAEINKLKEEKK